MKTAKATLKTIKKETINQIVQKTDKRNNKSGFAELTDVVLVNNLLERRQEAARTLAMLSDEGPIQADRGGRDILLHWTSPSTNVGVNVFYVDSLYLKIGPLLMICF